MSHVLPPETPYEKVRDNKSEKMIYWGIKVSKSSKIPDAFQRSVFFLKGNQSSKKKPT